jgi:stearoyl-CoA desaturase (delta-9 desaturase)
MPEKGKEKSNASVPNRDAEEMAKLAKLEARTSVQIAVRMLGKLYAMLFIGIMIAGNCIGNFCSSPYLVPLGVLILAVAAGWLDLIGNECNSKRFFPSDTLNAVGAILYRWQWMAFWGCTIFAFLEYKAGGEESFGASSFNERIWLFCKLALFPLTLMLIGKANEPYRFRHARSDIQKAMILLKQLAGAKNDSTINTSALTIDTETIPFYKLGSVANLLHDFASTYDAADQLKVTLADGKEAAEKPSSRLLSFAYAPFRRIAGDLLLWESRDIVLYIVVAMYMAFVYLGSFYFSWSPLCIVIPFMGPKSRAARKVRELQENIRLTQGRAAQEKGGLEPEKLEEKTGTVLNWPMIIYVGGTHLVALWALITILFLGGGTVKWQTYVFGFFMYAFNALGVTAGVHRLWAHRSYKANLPYRILLMVFNSIANQGTIFHWARDHRLHHKYSDTEADPHDAHRGFWFSHVGWLLVKKKKAVIAAGKTINVSDLLSDPVVMFQKRADPFWNLMWCFGVPAFTVLLWEDTAWNGFMIAGALRYVWALNATWAVNSVVHAWGSRPYNASHLTTENGWVSVFAIGEGWHNWHHAFPYDYAASELGAHLQFNPTKMFIDTCAFLGMVTDRKRCLNVWAQRKARWEKDQGRPVLEALEGPPLFKHRIVTFGPEMEESPQYVPEEIEKVQVEEIEKLVGKAQGGATCDGH